MASPFWAHRIVNTTTAPAEDPVEWGTTIGPRVGRFDLRIGELWDYRDLIVLLVRRDFVSQYKQTILGPLWHVINPLLTTIIMSVVFGGIAKIPTDGVPPFLFYLAGTTMWNYFARALTTTSSTFVSNAAIFGKVYFPRLAIPVAQMLSNLVAFGIHFTLFLACLAFYAHRGTAVQPNAALLLTPVLLLIMAGLGLGAGIIASAVTTRYRDLTQLITYGVQLLMYATPVIYPLSIVPSKLRSIVIANPMTPLVEGFRYAFLGHGSLSYLSLIYSAACALTALWLGTILFHRTERTFMDTV